MTQSPAPSPRLGLLICSDLFFTSKVTGTAHALNLQVDCVDSIAAALERLQADDIAFILLDLANPAISEAERFIRLQTQVGRPIVAFGSHVNAEVLNSARAAGAEIMPRSQFSATLPDILREYLSSPKS